MDDPKRSVTLSPDGTEEDYDRLLYAATIRLQRARTTTERSEARKDLSLVQRSVRAARRGRTRLLVPDEPSYRQRVEASLRGGRGELRLDQLFTDEELAARYGTGEVCPDCGCGVWDAGDGPRCAEGCVRDPNAEEV